MGLSIGIVGLPTWEVHPLQRASARRRPRRRTTLLHHRAERGGRAGARPPARPALRALQAEDHPHHARVRGHRRPRGRRVQGRGLGNQFLGNIRQVDAIAHVLRCFDDPDVVHVAGKVDPAGDKEVVETELMLKDLDSSRSGASGRRRTRRRRQAGRAREGRARRPRPGEGRPRGGHAHPRAEAVRRRPRAPLRPLPPHLEAGPLHRERGRVAARQGGRPTRRSWR